MAVGEEISYILIRKNVKNINLRVKRDGSVVVSANPCVPKKYIDQLSKRRRPEWSKMQKIS